MTAGNLVKHTRTTPKTPEAWLVIERGYAIGAFPSADPEALARGWEWWFSSDAPTTIVRDEPSLQVNHYGIYILNPSWLTARDNWFERYADILEKHLRDPAQAIVYTLAPGQLTDPFVTHKSSKNGPFPYPRGKEWPKCGFCHTRLGFLGVMDFRNCSLPHVPRASLVLHVCTGECGPCSNRETWSLTWIKEGDDIEILGESGIPVLVGTPWLATEYPRPENGTNAESMVNSGPFRQERGIFLNYSCFADKVGGHVFWIQPGYDPKDLTTPILTDENSFVTEEGERMTYIGQFTSSPDIEIGDSGLAYLLHSPRTGETIIDVQYF
jgi:hypothetical protein